MQLSEPDTRKRKAQVLEDSNNDDHHHDDNVAHDDDESVDGSSRSDDDDETDWRAPIFFPVAGTPVPAISNNTSLPFVVDEQAILACLHHSLSSPDTAATIWKPATMTRKDAPEDSVPLPSSQRILIRRWKPATLAWPAWALPE